MAKAAVAWPLGKLSCSLLSGLFMWVIPFNASDNATLTAKESIARKVCSLPFDPSRSKGNRTPAAKYRMLPEPEANLAHPGPSAMPKLGITEKQERNKKTRAFRTTMPVYQPG